MPKPKLPVSFLIISRKNATFFEVKTGKSFVFNLTDIVKDLEVIPGMAEEFNKRVSASLAESKLIPRALYILILPEVYYEKTFPEPPPEQDIGPAMEKFVDSVPFEYVRWHKFKIGKTIRVLAVNREYIDLMSQPFTALKYQLKAIAPLALLGITTATIQPKELLKKIETVEAFNMLEPAEGSDEANLAAEKKQERRDLRVLVPVFVGLLLILLVVVLKTFLLTPPVPAVKVLPTLPPVPVQATPLTPPIPTPLASESAVILGSWSFQVQSASSSTYLAAVKKKLESAGAVSVITEKVKTAPAQYVVIFSKNVPVNARSTILTFLTPIAPGLTSQEADQAKYDVVLLVGTEPVRGLP
jgi:hypothetical protein